MQDSNDYKDKTIYGSGDTNNIIKDSSDGDANILYDIIVPLLSYNHPSTLHYYHYLKLLWIVVTRYRIVVDFPYTEHTVWKIILTPYVVINTSLLLRLT